jgi:C4-dicarboxylate transporter DctM subunit
VTMLAVGAVLYPALTDNGYSRHFAIGALCAGGTLGIIIPPSVPMVLYGIMTETSIVSLFKAGIGPGILLTVAFTLYAVSINWHRTRLPFAWSELRSAIREGILALLMPLILLGGIYSGYFSATEAAAVAIGYALLVEVLIYREMKITDYVHTVSQSGILVGTLFPLLAVAMSINKLLTEKQVPGYLVDLALNNVDNPVTFILIVNGLLLLVGAVMDTASAIVITAPVLSTAAEAYGFDPVHLGVIMILNLEIGILTPPMGTNVIVAMTAFNEKFGMIVRSVIPWIAVMLVCLLVVTFVPWLSLVFI